MIENAQMFFRDIPQHHDARGEAFLANEVVNGLVAVTIFPRLYQAVARGQRGQSPQGVDHVLAIIEHAHHQDHFVAGADAHYLFPAALLRRQRRGREFHSILDDSNSLPGRAHMRHELVRRILRRADDKRRARYRRQQEVRKTPLEFRRRIIPARERENIVDRDDFFVEAESWRALRQTVK